LLDDEISHAFLFARHDGGPQREYVFSDGMSDGYLLSSSSGNALLSHWLAWTRPAKHSQFTS